MSGGDGSGQAHPVNPPVLLPGEAMDTLIGSIAASHPPVRSSSGAWP